MQRSLRSLSIFLVAAALQALPQPTLFATEQETAAPAQLSDGERDRLVGLLEASQTETDRLVAATSDAVWSEKPAPEKWSVAEVVEHLALAEEGLSGLYRQALENAPDPEWQTVAAPGIDGVLAALADRSQRFQAPEGFQPRGEQSRDELLARYAAARAATLEFVRTTQAPLKQHTASGPPGNMNVEQWLALVAAHNMRHNKQIEEVMAVVAAN